MSLKVWVYTLQWLRKNFDILLTIIVTLALTVAMLWPLEAPPPAPGGSDKLVHFIAFAALAFPLTYTGRFGLPPVFIAAIMRAGGWSDPSTVSRYLRFSQHNIWK